MKVLGRESLDSLRCDCGKCPDDDMGILSAQCHLGKPVYAVYRDGTIVLVCSVCHSLFMPIRVADYNHVLLDEPSWMTDLRHNGLGKDNARIISHGD